MLGRALRGLVKGGLAGALVATVLVHGFGLTTFGALWVAVVAVLLTGAFTAAVAGRPIWARGARIEAGLKALVGSLLGVGMLLLLRRYLPLGVTLPLELGNGPVGELPVVALPVVAGVLGLLFEVDHSGDPPPSERPARRRVARDARPVATAGALSTEADATEADQTVDEPRAARRHRR